MIGLDTDMVWKSLVFDRVAESDGFYADPDPIFEKKPAPNFQKKSLEPDSTLEKKRILIFTYNFFPFDKKSQISMYFNTVYHLW